MNRAVLSLMSFLLVIGGSACGKDGQTVSVAPTRDPCTESGPTGVVASPQVTAPTPSGGSKETPGGYVDPHTPDRIEAARMRPVMPVIPCPLDKPFPSVPAERAPSPEASDDGTVVTLPAAAPQRR